MCRSIQQLRGAEPAATDEEVRAAALQFVRKISGYRAPSTTNRAVFDEAVHDVAEVTGRLLEDLVVTPGSRPAAPATRRAGQGARA